jgi:hypothetical protein
VCGGSDGEEGIETDGLSYKDENGDPYLRGMKRKIGTDLG